MGRVIVFVGASGSGKTTLLRKCLHGNIVPIVGSTTRRPREHEKHGVDMHFHTEEEFMKLKDEGDMMEHTEYAGNHYGLTRDELESVKKTPDSVFHGVAMNLQGLRFLRNYFGKDNVIGVFVYVNELHARYRMRMDQRSEEAIDSRVAFSKKTQEYQLFGTIREKCDFTLDTTKMDEETMIDVMNYILRGLWK